MTLSPSSVLAAPRRTGSFAGGTMLAMIDPWKPMEASVRGFGDLMVAARGKLLMMKSVLMKPGLMQVPVGAPCVAALLPGAAIPASSLAVILAVILLSIMIPAGGACAVLIQSPEEVLALHTVVTAEGLFFRDATGRLTRLITSTDDPQIANRGDGSFHPLEVTTIHTTLAGIDARFQGAVEATIYVLPYPRDGIVHSTAEESAVYLCPGVRPYAPSQIHFLIAHEFGHLVHRQLLPDTDTDGWETYLAVRGIANAEHFSADAPHAWRPHEIFAEDFRVLFGGPMARATSVENRQLTDPSCVPGLVDFFFCLLERSTTGSTALREEGPTAGANRRTPSMNSVGVGGGSLLSFSIYPNPFFSGANGNHLRIHVQWLQPVSQCTWSVILFNAAGRRVRTLGRGMAASRASGRTSIDFELRWDGRDEKGRQVAAGVYMVRLRAGMSEEWRRVVVGH